jgi:hypothetical protein
MTETASDDLIELRVDNIAQLFHTLDPFPFRERDLDKEAEEFIVGWARELAADHTITIIIHFPEAEAQTKAARELEEAFRRYFSDHANATQLRNVLSYQSFTDLRRVSESASSAFRGSSIARLRPPRRRTASSLVPPICQHVTVGKNLR